MQSETRDKKEKIQESMDTCTEERTCTMQGCAWKICFGGWEAHSAYWISPTKHGERPSKYYAAAEPGSRQAYPQNRIRMQQCDDTKAKEAKWQEKEDACN